MLKKTTSSLPACNPNQPNFIRRSIMQQWYSMTWNAIIAAWESSNNSRLQETATHNTLWTIWKTIQLCCMYRQNVVIFWSANRQLGTQITQLKYQCIVIIWTLIYWQLIGYNNQTNYLKCATFTIDSFVWNILYIYIYQINRLPQLSGGERSIKILITNSLAPKLNKGYIMTISEVWLTNTVKYPQTLLNKLTCYTLQNM